MNEKSPTRIRPARRRALEQQIDRLWRQIDRLADQLGATPQERVRYVIRQVLRAHPQVHGPLGLLLGVGQVGQASDRGRHMTEPEGRP